MSSINIPGYKIIKTLGVGGQATVYLAIQQGFDREIALKVMSPALAADPSFGERFLREAKIVAKLRHTSIVTVYDVGEHDGFYYLAMEYLPETDLRTRIEGGLKAKDALQIIQSIGKALHFAHKQGYIHRDVKSENILFRSLDEPVLTDFGIAKASNSSTQMTQQGKLIGTPQYMSPEQCRGRALDGRSDIYSLGIIFYEMLTQSVPFEGEDSVAVCLQHVTKPIPRLPARQQHYQWLLDRMLAKEPEDRFHDAEKMAKEIERFVSGEVSPSHAPTITIESDQISARRDDYSKMEEEEFGSRADSSSRIGSGTKSSSRRWPYVVFFLVLIGAGGFFTQAKWLPQAKNILAQMSGESASQVADSSLQQTTLPAEKVAVQNQIANLLVEANSLLGIPKLSPQQAEQVLQNFLRVMALEQDNPKASSGIMTATKKIKQLAEEALAANDYEAFDSYRSVIKNVLPQHNVLEEFQVVEDNWKNSQQLAVQETERQEQVKAFLKKGESALLKGDLTKPVENNAWYFFQQALLIDESNASALEGQSKVIDRVMDNAKQALSNKDPNGMKNNIDVLKQLNPESSEIGTLEQEYTELKAQVEEEQKRIALANAKKAKEEARKKLLADPLTKLKISSKLDAAQAAYDENRLVTPEADNALSKYKEVLDIDDQNQRALDGIKLIEEKLVSQTKNAIANSDISGAEENLIQLKTFFSNNPLIPVLQQQISEIDVVVEQPVEDELTLNTRISNNPKTRKLT
ncbi:MAG: protein kinase [Gammaproteobacteria bacterium]|nr:protein kinase [Gammaproteobacteria bacterium]